MSFPARGKFEHHHCFSVWMRRWSPSAGIFEDFQRGLSLLYCLELWSTEERNMLSYGLAVLLPLNQAFSLLDLDSGRTKL
jgi:hypothetical protein